MAIIKIVNAEGGSDARYDVRRMTPEERTQFDSEGRPLGSNNPGQWTWTPGLPGARGGNDNSHMGMPGGEPGNAGGSVIPGAGTYLEMQAAAEKAYMDAVTALKTQRSQRQKMSGLGDDWSVNPLAQYGTYQQMLGGQGFQLDAAEANAVERGLMGPGLGNQAERALRYGHAVENLGFKNQLSQWENEFQSGMGQAEYARKMAQLQALQSAMGSAYGDWGGSYDDYSDPGPGAQGLAGGSSTIRNIYGQSRNTNVLGSGRVAQGAAGFGGGLAAALINQRTPTKQKSTATNYTQARRLVR